MKKSNFYNYLIGVTLVIGIAQGAFAQPYSAPSSLTYRVISRHILGGTDGWDYLALDAKRHRLFVSRATHVQVVDARTGKIIGDIPDTPGVHGIAFAQDLGLGFISDGKANMVTVFALGNLKTLGTIKVTGADPDFIYYEPVHKRIITGNGDGNNLTVIDAVQRKVIGTIPLPGNPEAMVSDKQGQGLFVNLESRNEIARVDLRSKKVAARWSISACEKPTGLAMDHKHQRLFAVCHNDKMMVVSARTGKVVQEITNGTHADAAYFDPVQRLAFSSNGGDGTLTIVHEDTPDTYTVKARLATEPGARTMAIDPRTHHVYLVSARFGAAPAPTAAKPHPRPPIEPDTFNILEVAPQSAN